MVFIEKNLYVLCSGNETNENHNHNTLNPKDRKKIEDSAIILSEFIGDRGAKVICSDNNFDDLINEILSNKIKFSTIDKMCNFYYKDILSAIQLSFNLLDHIIVIGGKILCNELSNNLVQELDAGLPRMFKLNAGEVMRFHFCHHSHIIEDYLIFGFKPITNHDQPDLD